MCLSPGPWRRLLCEPHIGPHDPGYRQLVRGLVHDLVQNLTQQILHLFGGRTRVERVLFHRIAACQDVNAAVPPNLS